MIDIEKQLHGLAISLLSLSIGDEKKYTMQIKSNTERSGYDLTVKNESGFFKKNKLLKIGIYIKISQKRRGPWAFTFKKIHQEYIDKMNQENHKTFVILINSNDGIVSLNYEELRKLLDYKHEDAEGIRVSRKLKQSYRLSGRDGKLKYTIPPSNYPKKIINYIKDKI